MHLNKLSIKCISLDLDGTLVFLDGFARARITEKNVSAIKEFCRRGNNCIILATGRGVDRTLEVFHELCDRGVDASKIPYLICLNGAVIVDTKKPDKLIGNHHFGHLVAEKVVQFLKRKRFNYFLINSKNEVIHPLNFISFLVYTLWLKRRYPRRNLRADADLSRIQKVMVIPRMLLVKKWRGEFLREFGDVCYVSECCSFCLEISDKTVDKFYGIQKVAEIMGLEVDDFAAIGNEQNDVRSLESVGFGVGLNLTDRIAYDKYKIGLNIVDTKGTGVAQAIYEMKNRGF